MKIIKPCNCKNFFKKKLFSYSKRPKKEKKFNIKRKYKREYFECLNCGHVYAKLFFDLNDIYNEQYFDYTYSSLKNLKLRFNFVKNLKFIYSDNKNRVKRINEYFKKQKKLDLLDVGSGIGIFLYEMKKKNWNCLGLDLDKRYKKFCNDFLRIKVLDKRLQDLRLKKKFNLITFNKVLEHLEDPISMLKESKKLLKSNGSVYLEVPDSNVKKLGKFRDEFCVDHLHLFSMASVSNMALRAGFDVDCLKRIIDPSGKYTIYAFLNKN